MVTMFRKAVDELFPKVDESFRAEIEKRVSEHIFESLKEELYQNKEELKQFEEKLMKMENKDDRSRSYGEELNKRLSLLPEARQKEIADRVNKELARVMHELYNAYNTIALKIK